jgi:hypothetical protein
MIPTGRKRPVVKRTASEALDSDGQLLSARTFDDLDDLGDLNLLFDHRPLVVENIDEPHLTAHGVARMQANNFSSSIFFRILLKKTRIDPALISSKIIVDCNLTSTDPATASPSCPKPSISSPAASNMRFGLLVPF